MMKLRLGFGGKKLLEENHMQNGKKAKALT
jgi:hypothetical protein